MDGEGDMDDMDEYMGRFKFEDDFGVFVPSVDS